MTENKSTIVIIEDEPLLLMAIEFKLKKIGYKVYAVKSGEEGLKIIKDKKPDLIWSDLLLPGISGLELLKTVKGESEIDKIPFVIVSVSAGSEKIREAYSLGVEDYIVKSDYDIDFIIEKVVKLINT